MKKAVFFDRDGTLMEECHYCSDPAKVSVFSGVPEALARLRRAGWLVIMVTNQSGIGRGYFTEKEYEAVQEECLRQLGEEIDASYYCGDAPDKATFRRKPQPGMILEAAGDWDIDLSASYIVGDKDDDMLCGSNAGLRTVLVLTGHGTKADSSLADHVAPDAVEAVKYIMQSGKSDRFV